MSAGRLAIPRGVRAAALCALVALGLPTAAGAADFGSPGGPLPGNLGEVAAVLRQDPWDLELLVSFGTSKGGSAGHLALAIRDEASAEGSVWSANFYADRKPEHATDFYTDELMVRVPKLEYLYGTTSTLSPKASFGLDYGEVYKRSVVGIRVFGVPAAEKAALAAFFARVNDDYRRGAGRTDYHDREVRYDYLRLNCAKTIGAAFRVGAGYRDLEVKRVRLLPGRPLAAAVNANVPTEMAMKLIAEWHARGYRMDVVLYRKYDGSPYVDPHDDEKVAFRDLPNRFPSVLSRDFRREQGEYEDFDNLYAAYLLYNMGRYAVRVDGATRRLVVGKANRSLQYPEATQRAARSAAADSEGYGRRQPFRPEGTMVGEITGDE